MAPAVEWAVGSGPTTPRRPGLMKAVCRFILKEVAKMMQRDEAEVAAAAYRNSCKLFETNGSL